MMTLFLSASIPLPGRDPKYMATADTIAIRDAIKALVGAALDQGTIVFGGHPAITPLIALLLRGMPIETRRRVVLYQSAFYEKDFIDETNEFIDLRLVPARNGDKKASEEFMRKRMIESHKFDAAIFIGGMEGIWDEYRLFQASHPDALCLPIGSTGAAALELYSEIAPDRPELMQELTYPTLFRNLLSEISHRKTA